MQAFSNARLRNRCHLQEYGVGAVMVGGDSFAGHSLLSRERVTLSHPRLFVSQFTPLHSTDQAFMRRRSPAIEKSAIPKNGEANTPGRFPNVGLQM
jgi:hypothetical protein